MRKSHYFQQFSEQLDFLSSEVESVRSVDCLCKHCGRSAEEMSLKTLLEAAEFLELEEPRKTRDGSGNNFHRYCKKSPSRYDSDESNEDSRERRRSGGAGTREVHNKLEKNRRAHLKECFDTLKYQVPSIQDKKTSNLTILRGALRYIQALRRKEKDCEQEMQKWALEKIALQQRIHSLKGDLTKMNIEFDLELWVSNQDQETASTSTASENGNAASDGEEGNKTVTPKPETKAVVKHSKVSTDVPVTESPAPKIPAETNVPRPKLLNAAIMAPAVPQIYRTPVAQILHQTLTQRAALQQLQTLQRQQLEFQQQQAQQQKDLVEKASVSLPNSVPAGVPVAKSAAQVTAHPTVTTSVPLQANPAPIHTPITTMSKLATAIAMPITATPKSIGQALAMSAPGTTGTVTVLTTTASVSTAASPSITKATPSVTNTPTMQVGLVGAAPLNQSLSASLINHRIANQNTVMSSNIKQLLSTPGTHLVTAGTQLAAINPIRTSTLGQMLSAVTNVAGVTIAGGNPMSAVHPVVSFAHLTPGTTHIMSPVSVVSPNVHVSNLSQQQLNNMIQQQPLLKSLNQLPLLQPQFIQAGQVVGQQMVKPVVLVPSVAVTSSGQPGQVAVSVTQATS